MVGGPETILLYLVVILVGAKIGSEAAIRLKQPAVLGEILVGVIIGPSLLGLIPPFEILDAAEHFFKTATAESTLGSSTLVPGDFGAAQNLGILALVAELGVLILLFEVGLESNLREFRRVGPSAGLVGLIGVVGSLLVGAAASYAIAIEFDWVLTEEAMRSPWLLHAFVGATLTATSVGITARVLGDMNAIRTREAQVILGAAVIDDVLGLVVLAIIGGLVVDPSGLTALGVTKVFAIAIGFFVAAIALGVLVAPRFIDAVHRAFHTSYVHLGFAFILMLVVAYLATAAGLASIVGAFAAGLALSSSPHRHMIFEHLKPVGSLFIGFFFVVLGARVDLSQVTAGTLPIVLAVGAILSLVGILGKLACGWGVLGGQADRLVVGVGMVPRGEVGLIFALFGLEHGLLTNWQYSTVILVVLLTTLITPFWLKGLSGRFGQPLEERPAQARLGEAIDP